jgi:hypothetical protein
MHLIKLTVCSSGKKRKFQFVIQGQFKETISYASVYIGQMFEEPLRFQPPQWVLSTLMPIIRLVQPGVCLDLHSDTPYILSPLMSTMQTVDVSMLGEEPSLMDMMRNGRDSLGIVDKCFKDMKADQRKCYFAKR